MLHNAAGWCQIPGNWRNLTVNMKYQTYADGDDRVLLSLGVIRTFCLVWFAQPTNR